MMKASLRGTIIGEEAWGHNYAEEVIRIVTREAKPKLEKTFTRSSPPLFVKAQLVFP